MSFRPRLPKETSFFLQEKMVRLCDFTGLSLPSDCNFLESEGF